MPQVLLFVADLVAVGLLTFGLSFPRHRRRDLVVAYLGVNVGVLAVASALSTSTVGAGLGLGLFGVLSIIRLRSSELEQHEVAYYFTALALGLLGGLHGVDPALGIGLMVLLVAVMYVGDHPRLFTRYEHQQIVLDTAITDDAALRARIEQLLEARVHQVTVLKVDLVNDTTAVDVRFERGARPATAAPGAPSGSARTADPVGSTLAGAR